MHKYVCMYADMFLNVLIKFQKKIVTVDFERYLEDSKYHYIVHYYSKI